MRIVTIVGSLQQRSANRALAELFARTAPAGCDVTEALRLDELPFYNADLDRDPPPPAVATWRAQLRAADGVLIVCPEYGHGMPGALKNALDWVVGSGEFVGKPVAVTSAAQGKGRGLLGLASLVTTLRAIDAVVVWSHTVVVPRLALPTAGAIVDPAITAEAQVVLERLLRAF